MQTQWIVVIVNRLPEEFAEGVVLSEGFDDNAEPPDSDQLQFAILARAGAPADAEALRLVKEAVSTFDPIASVTIADWRDTIVRSERRIGAELQPGDVSIKASFIGFKRDSATAQKVAISVIETAIHKKWWQLWR